MNEQHLDLGGAVQWIANRIAEIVSRFRQLSSTLPISTEKKIQEYVDGLAGCVRSNEVWSFESGRYFGSKGLEIRKSKRLVLSSKRRN